VILKGVPAVTVVRVVKEKGFCADAMPAKKAAARREREYCILTSLSKYITKLPVNDDMLERLKIDR
jgi:hypothetical protein